MLLLLEEDGTSSDTILLRRIDMLHASDKESVSAVIVDRATHLILVEFQ